MPSGWRREAEPGATLRPGVLVLAVLGSAGTGFELGTERHWRNAIQFVPWVALGVIVLAQGLLALGHDRGRLVAVRVLAVLVALTSVFGIVEHIRANLDAGVLDGVYGTGWAAMPLWQQLEYAATKTVGPAPPLAAGVLAQVALLTLLATWRHPALSRAAGRSAAAQASGVAPESADR